MAGGDHSVRFSAGAVFCGDGGAAARCLAERGFWLCGAFRLGSDGRYCPLDGAGSDGGRGSEIPDHWGFDVAAIEKALSHNEKRPTRIRGASTLSQQTAKNLFLWDGRSWVRKGLEAGLTAGIELVWTKRRILTVYLNIVEFGDGIFGVEAAAQHFFHKPASRLTTSEAALLAAVLPNPHRFKAGAPSGYVTQRQQWIMRQMRQLGGEGFLKANNLK